MSSPALVDAAATILADRLRGHSAGERLPESCRPTDLATALAIQEKTGALLGAQTGGWKCGTPAPDKLVLAPIHAGDIHRVSPCPVHAPGGKLRIEPELAFILGRDLPGRTEPYSEAEIDGAIAAVHLALELIGSRYRHPAEVPFAEHLADRLLNQGLFIGPAAQAEPRVAASMPLAVNIGGSETVHDARHPDGNPLLPLYWLANFLREQGRGLQAGDAIITGSLVPSFEVPTGQDVALRFGPLGELRVRFESRSAATAAPGG